MLILDQMIEYYVEKFFMKKCGFPKANFVPLHWQGDSFAYSMLITVLYLIWTKGPRESWNEDGSQSLAKHIIRVRT